MNLAGQTVELELPARLVHREDIASAAAEHPREQTARRVVAAALALCWPSVRHKKGFPAYKGDILDYGGDVIEYLRQQGATMNQIIEAGNAAVKLVIDDAVTAQHLEAARGNSSAPEASSNRGGSSGGTQSGGAG